MLSDLNGHAPSPETDVGTACGGTIDTLARALQGMWVWERPNGGLEPRASSLELDTTAVLKSGRSAGTGSTVQNFKKLKVWQRSMANARLCFQACESLPTDQRYGLRSQMHRSAISIPSNIAEGAGRRSNRDFARFLRIAYSSACELETQALVAIDLGLGHRQQFDDLLASLAEIQTMLSSLIQTLRD